jgi:hypothetical protein
VKESIIEHIQTKTRFTLKSYPFSKETPFTLTKHQAFNLCTLNSPFLFNPLASYFHEDRIFLVEPSLDAQPIASLIPELDHRTPQALEQALLSCLAQLLLGLTLIMYFCFPEASCD